MNRFIRYWNQNRKKIIITIAIIAFVIVVIQILNNYLKNNSNIDNTIRKTVDETKPIQSAITGETVSEQITDENTNVIKEFVDYCNNKEYENAYSLLSDDCKVEFNNDINTFLNNYYKKVFKTTKTYKLELWINTSNVYTYKVTYYENNLLATGSTSMNKNIEDYITIIKQNNENKINLNGFIQKVDINKSQTSNNIEIIINSKKIYKNYETYNITIKNGTSKTILLSDKQNNNDICIVDKNNVEYLSFLDEIILESLSLKSGQEKNINIRFNKIYDLYRIIEKMQFSNIILDEEQYTKNPKDSNIQRIGISINI